MNEVIEMEVDYKGQYIKGEPTKIPTKTSDLINDSKFITEEDLPDGHEHNNKKTLDLFSCQSLDTGFSQDASSDELKWRGKSVAFENGLTATISGVEEIEKNGAKYLRLSLSQGSVIYNKLPDYIDIPVSGVTDVEEKPSPDITLNGSELDFGFTGGEGGSVDLTNYYTKQEIDDKGFITTDDILNGGGSPEELSILEKKLILSLFKNATYTADVSNVISALESIWRNDEAPLCHITNNLTNVNTNNSVTDIKAGDSYLATLTANEGYAIDSVVVMMNGEDITKTAYNSSGEIHISIVTGDITIVAVAVAVITYTIGGIMTADGSETNATNRIKTDFIPYSGGSIQLQNCDFAGRGYDSNKIYIEAINADNADGFKASGWCDDTMSPYSLYAFIRIVAKKYDDSNFDIGEFDNVVLTVGNTKYRLKGV